MKIKQLESIKRRHNEFLTAGATKEPDCDCDIKVAIISSEPPKLRPAAEIIEAFKRKLVCDRYNVSLSLSEVFKTPTSGKKAEWERAEADRKKRVKAYRDKADVLLINAELNDESEAQEVMAELSELARANGLYA